MLEDISDNEFGELSIVIARVNELCDCSLVILRHKDYVCILDKDADLEGQYFNDTIYFDRYSLWDKPSKAPVFINLKNAAQNIDLIVKDMRWLLSQNGYIGSNNLERRPRIV
jgi:hypothetical protein